MALGLDNTLNGMDPNTLSQALEEEILNGLAQRTTQATSAAQQAGQQYQQAAGAPPAQLAPEDIFLPTLLGNIASVIGQNPDFREQAQENIKASRAELLKSRADNLQAMRDVFSQKADLAQRAGDLETQEKSRLKMEQLSKIHDQVLEQQKQAGRLELEEERGKNDLAVAGVRRQETQAQAVKEQQANQRIKNSAIQSLTSAVRQDPDIKNFVTVRDQFQMGLSGSQGKSNLGDILLMRAIARVSDPLSSVREEEFRTFKGAQGALAQHGVNLTRAMWGKGMLSDFGRTQMLQQLRQIYANKKVQYNRAYSQYRFSGEAQGVEPQLYLRDYTVPEEAPDAGVAPPAVASSEGYVLMESPDGKSRKEVPKSKVPEMIKSGARRVAR